MTHFIPTPRAYRLMKQYQKVFYVYTRSLHIIHCRDHPLNYIQLHFHFRLPVTYLYTTHICIPGNKFVFSYFGGFHENGYV